MYSLEKNNSWISDGTYLAFDYFMKNIVPNYISEGIENNERVLYISINNTNMGVFVGNYNLGRINYHEFISYIYGLSSFKGFRLQNVERIVDNYNAPFDLEGLIHDYYGELQSDEYFSYIENEKAKASNSEEAASNCTYLAYENFLGNVIGEILKDALEGKYEIEDILGDDGVTIMAKFLYVPLEIKYDDFFVGRHNLGKVNSLEFLNYLTSMSSYIGMRNNNLEQEITFNVEQLIKDYRDQLAIR